MTAPASASKGCLALRRAGPADIDVLEQLIAVSARALGKGFYSEAETEAALAHVFGVDSELVADGTYLVATDQAGVIVGCGGWSRRRTLFGGDRYGKRIDGLLDPATDAARIRAFFVAPAAARQGVASLLLNACEAAARKQRFGRTTLMATLPGVPFYRARGYVAGAPISQACGDVAVAFVPMDKTLC